jgi:hypothetical protein
MHTGKVNPGGKMLSPVRITALVLAVSALTATGRAAEDESAAHRPGRAAAHAALTDGADLPANPPSLPDLALEGARRVDPASVGRKPDTTREAASQADQHASANSRAERDEQVNRIAQSSVAAAVRSATTDARVAASQARTSGAKAKASAAHGVGMHPPPKHP